MRLVCGDSIREFAKSGRYFYRDTHNIFGNNFRTHSTFLLGLSLITHNSDGNIIDRYGRECDVYFQNVLDCIEGKWYCQNMDVLNDRIRPLPIGLENHHWHKGNKFKEIESVFMQDIPRKNWLYVNHEISTNPGERAEPYRIFRNKGFCSLVEQKKSYLDYIKDMKSHRFVLCPEGNGFDTHRTWEALYMGSIPIVKRRIFTEMFSRIMPILIVEDWKIITLDFLQEVYNKMKQITWPYGDKYLDMTFWEDVIKGRIKIG